MSGRSEPSSPRRSGSLRRAVGDGALRGCCGAVGLFTTLNVLAGWARPGLNGNEWLLDARWLGAPGDLLLLGCGVALAGRAVRPSSSAEWRWAAIAAIGGLGAIAAVNVAVFYTLVARGQVVAGVPVPLSAVVCLVLAMMLAGVLQRPAAAVCACRPASAAVAACTFGALASVFPAAQMVFFGNTSYARPVDAIVVFGARAYADGRPSDALSDRVLHACALYHDGLAPVVIMSGGPGDGDIHESEAMRDLAIAEGVNAAAILLDYQGVSTGATVANAAEIMHTRGLTRGVAVSHFYHLPRIRLLAEREGIDLYTSPSPQRDGPLVRLPWFMARESAAFWVYWVRAWTP